MQFGPASWQTRLLNVISAVFIRPVLGALTLLGLMINRISPAVLQRARLDVIDAPMRLLRPLRGTTVTPSRLPDCPAEWVIAPGVGQGERSDGKIGQGERSDGKNPDDGPVIIYFHGSALVTLGLNTYRRFASKLSAATGARVFNVGYRLAPLASIEEAVSDGLEAYRFVLATGVPPERIVFAGDSAGGLIAADTAIAARDAGLPVPAGQVLLSALTSADMELKYLAIKDHFDVLFPASTVRFIYDVFATVNGTRDVPVMPAETNMTGLGPFLLQVGTHEMLRNDTFVLADQLAAHGVPVWVQVWDRTMHMFQLQFDVNPDAVRAIAEIASFVDHVTAVGRNQADREEASA